MKRDLHAKLAAQAILNKISLNSYINECLEKVIS